MLPILRETSRVHSLFTCELLHARSIQFHGTDMLLPRVTRVGEEEHTARRFVDSLNSQHFEVAMRKLALKFRVSAHRVLLIEAVEVEMHVSVAPTGPQESATRLKETNFRMIKFNPCARSSFRQNNSRLSRLRIHEVQVYFVLVTVEHLRPHHAIAHPAKPRDVGLLVVCQGDPAHFAFVSIHHAELHRGIRVPHFRVLFVVHGRMRRNPIRDGIRGNLGFIHVQKDDLFAVGRPEIIAAHG